MHPDLPLLQELQRIDDEIVSLRREIARLPKHIAEIEQQLADHKAKLKADQAALEENKKLRRQLEASIEDHERKAARLQEQMNEAKTNEQYRAFQHEIEYQKNQISQAEDQILDKMEEAEALQENVQRAEAALAVENEKVAREVEHAQRDVRELESRLEQGQTHRGELAARVAPASLSLYERIRVKRGGAALAKSDGERCLACNVVMRPQFSRELRFGDDLKVCESCARILYYQAPGEGVEDPFHEQSRLRN